ncbi:hypothetical protein Ccrd_013731, partial [Cynara cardunculus var. scolymus]
MKKYSFLNFKNTIDNPVDVDEEQETTKSVGRRVTKQESREGKQHSTVVDEVEKGRVVKTDTIPTGDQSRKATSNPNNERLEYLTGDLETRVTHKDKRTAVGHDKEVIGEHNDAKDTTLGIRTRTSPKTLYDKVKSLTLTQRASIKDMGFESLQDMMVDGIPTKLGFYVVDMLNTTAMNIRMNDGAIPIRVKSIHEVLKLPMGGGIDLNSVEQSSCLDDMTTAWRKQFTKERMRPKDVMNVVHKSADAGAMFKLSFLVIVINTLAECSQIQHQLYEWKTPRLGKKGFMDRVIPYGRLLPPPPARSVGNPLPGRRSSSYLVQPHNPSRIDRLFQNPETRSDVIPVRLHFSETLQVAWKEEPTVHDQSQPLTADATPPTTGHLPTLAFFEVTPPKVATISDPDLLSPLSQFWTSPTVIAEVDRASNEKSAQRTRYNIRSTQSVHMEKFKMPSFQSPVEKVGSVRNRSIDQSETRTRKMCKRGIVDAVKYTPGNSEQPIVSYGDIEPPSFDLGLSPSDKQVVAVVDNSNAVAIQEYLLPTLAKRDSKLSFKLRSPYITRVVTFDVTSDKFVVTPNGRTLTRKAMQSLASQSVVCRDVLDGWLTVLNREERLRSHDSSRRYFYPTDVSMNRIIRDRYLDVHQRYESFKNNVSSYTINDKGLISMHNIDLIFFPIVEDTFYYMVVFDLKHPSIVIIDSTDRDVTVDDIYGSSTVSLQDMMIMHLLREGHEAGKIYAEMDQEQIRIRWQSRESSVDYSVMLMRHMETYFGCDGGKWDCGFYKESTKQKRQLKGLRTKYCSILLLSEKNIRKSAIIIDVERFIAMETSYNAKNK